jgi:hypothetical protein
MASTNPGGALEHNSHLATKLETLTGTANPTDLEKDASAFKNFGQFVAAAHVSKNLNIPGGFAALNVPGRVGLHLCAASLFP